MSYEPNSKGWDSVNTLRSSENTVCLGISESHFTVRLISIAALPHSLDIERVYEESMVWMQDDGLSGDDSSVSFCQERLLLVVE